MAKKVTTHGKYRIRERVDSNANLSSLRHQVLNSGKNVYDYNGKFFQYLMSKERNDRYMPKVYKNNIYIFTKNSKRIITTYQIPEKYLPLVNYEIPKKAKEIRNLLVKYNDKYINIFLKDSSVYYGKIIINPNIPMDYINLILDDKSKVKISCQDVSKIVSYYGEILYEDEQLIFTE